ncbi:MAG: HNH endonuclease [Nanoarchaeota archaeon]
MAQKSIMQMIDEMSGKGTSHIREPLTTTDKQRVLYRQKGKCKGKKCGGVDFYKKQVRIHYDHIRPVKAGGKKGKDLKNIQALCPNCHDWKTHMKDKPNKRRKTTRNPLGIGIGTSKIKLPTFKQPKIRVPRIKLSRI